MYRPPKKDWDYEAVAALQAAGGNVVAKAKGKPAMERPNWSLLIVGIGPYPIEPCQKIVRRFKDLGHRISHASLLLDGSRSVSLVLDKNGHEIKDILLSTSGRNPTQTAVTERETA